MDIPYRDNNTISLPKRGWSEFFHPKKWKISRVVTANNVPFLEGVDGSVYRRNLKPYKGGRKRAIFECQHRKEKRCNAQYEEYVSHLGQCYYRKYKNPHSCGLDKMEDEEQQGKKERHEEMSENFPKPSPTPQEGPFRERNKNQEFGNNLMVKRPPPPQTQQPHPQQRRNTPNNPLRQRPRQNFPKPRGTNFGNNGPRPPRHQDQNRRKMSNMKVHGAPTIHRFFPEKGSPKGNNLVDIYCSFGFEYNNWIFQSQVNPARFCIRFGETPAAKVIEVTRSHMGRLSHQMTSQDHQTAGVLILVRDFPHAPGPVKISITYPVRGGMSRLITSTSDFVYEDVKVQLEAEIEGAGETLGDEEEEEEDDNLFPPFSDFDAPSGGTMMGDGDVSVDEGDLFYWKDENINPFGYNLLLYSCSKSLKNVRYLVEKKKFRLDVTDNFGNGVLHVASYFKKLDIYDFLLYKMISNKVINAGDGIPINCFGIEAKRPEPFKLLNKGKMSRKEIKIRTQIWQLTMEINTTDDSKKRLEMTYLRGRKYFDIHEIDLAIEDFEMCIDQDESPAEKVRGYYGKGNVWQSLDEPKLAIEEYNKCLLFDSKCSEAYYGKGLAFKKLLLFKEAYENFSKAIANNEELAYSYYERAVILHRFGENDRSVEDYSKCLNIYPEFVQALNGRGNVYRVLNRSDLALGDYQEALRINEEYIHAYNGRGNVFLDVGDLEKARKNYEECLKINGKYIYAYYGLGNVAYQEKKFNEAVKNYSVCLKINPNYRLALKRLEEAKKLV